MEFNTRRITVRGEAIVLRELSGEVLDLLDEPGSETKQSLRLVALSLCDDAGAPRFTGETIDEGVRFLVHHYPLQVIRDELVPAVTAMNAMSMDDARGN